MIVSTMAYKDLTQKRVFILRTRYLRAKTDTSFQPLFDPELKDKIDDYYVLPDDPLVKPPPLSPTYRSFWRCRVGL